MSEGGSPDPFARLGERLDRAQAGRGRLGAPEGSSSKAGYGPGFRIGIELVAAVCVGLALGWVVDRFFGTRPWGMIAFFFLGVAAGMVNVYRAVTNIGMAIGYQRHGGSSADTRVAAPPRDED